jgi:hypothetical protein
LIFYFFFFENAGRLKLRVIVNFKIPSSKKSYFHFHSNIFARNFVKSNPGLSVEKIVGFKWNLKKMKFLVAAIFFIANYHIASSGQINFHKNTAFSHTKNISFFK